MYTDQVCRHFNLTSTFCKDCGIYINLKKFKVALKTSRFYTPFQIQPSKYFHDLKKRSQTTTSDKTSLLDSLDKNIVQFISTLVFRFRFSMETHALGLTLFYCYVSPKISADSNRLLYSSQCLLLAAKMVERSKVLPTLDSFRKHACGYLNKQEHVNAEIDILRLLDYNLHNTATFISFICFFMTHGVVAVGEPPRQKFSIAQFQRSLIAKANELLVDGRFLRFEPCELAIYLIYKSRQAQKISPAWPDWIAEYSCIDSRYVQELVASSRFQGLLAAQPQQTQKMSNSINNSLSKQPSSSCANLTTFKCSLNLQRIISNNSSQQGGYKYITATHRQHNPEEKQEQNLMPRTSRTVVKRRNNFTIITTEEDNRTARPSLNRTYSGSKSNSFISGLTTKGQQIPTTIDA